MTFRKRAGQFFFATWLVFVGSVLGTASVIGLWQMFATRPHVFPLAALVLFGGVFLGALSLIMLVGGVCALGCVLSGGDLDVWDKP